MRSNRKSTETLTIVAIVLMSVLIVIGTRLLSNNNKSDKNTPDVLVDGTYTAEASELSNGFLETVTIVVEDGKVSSLLYDSINDQGQGKRHLSSVGEYIMTESNPIWEEQADLLAQYVIENQSTKGLNLDDSGKTDAVSGVSITISSFVNLTEQALEKAASK